MHCIIAAVHVHNPACRVLSFFSINTVTPKLNPVASPVLILFIVYISLYE
jgi:hypothetical protein